MKRKLVDCCKLAAVFAIVALGLWNCKDDPNNIGFDILPASDYTKVGQSVEVESNKAFTRNDTILRTDGLPYNIFGTFNDPVFGKTTAEYACQFRTISFPDFEENAVLDSVILSISYKEFFGDTITPQTIRVYELKDDIYADSTGSGGTVEYKYYQDVELKPLAFSDPVAEFTFTPKFEMDSTETDTLIQELRIPINNELSEKLFNSQNLEGTNFNEVFLEYFKGLYIEADDIDTGGGLIRILSSSRYTYLGMYYNYYDASEDSTYEKAFYLPANENAARISSYVHDYSQADFASSLDNETEMDSLIYLQTMGGLRTKIELPSLDHWRDSVDTGKQIGVNKAVLVFQVDTVASNYPNFNVPSQILLTALSEDGKEYFPTDFSISPILYGGYFNDSDNTYRFNITRHLQDIIDKRNDPDGKQIANYGFYLSTYNKESQASRVVLKGATSTVGIRLEVTYVKYN